LAFSGAIGPDFSDFARLSTQRQIVKKELLLSLVILFVGDRAHAQIAQGKTKFLGNILGNDRIDPGFSTYWNQITPENSGKWGSVEATPGLMDWSRLDAAYRYAKSHKEHNFVWGRHQPAWIDTLSQDQQKLAVENWIRSYGQRYPDTQLIDVVNEPLHDPPRYKGALGGDGTTGWDWLVWSFVTARRYCPHSKLLLNEYGILSGGPDLERYLAIIRILRERHLIDGIGLQGHNLENVGTNMIRSSLGRLKRFELPIYISELDFDITDDDAQLKRYASVFPVFWNDWAVAGITLWGYKQNHTWRPHTYLLRTDGSERPALTWLKKYVATSKSR
jgi:endo-1,4-beta-xylanase